MQESTIVVTFKNGSKRKFKHVVEVYDGGRVFELKFKDGRVFSCHSSTMTTYEEVYRGEIKWKL